MSSLCCPLRGAYPSRRDARFGKNDSSPHSTARHPLSERPTLVNSTIYPYQLAAFFPLDRLRSLPAHELPIAVAAVRDFLIQRVTAAGGHLGSNLGVADLTVALHRVFDSPRDALRFDTGHRAYVHKIVTGRAAAFTSLRQQDGLSGYPSRAESAHDVIENSHTSTALSYACGLACARRLTERANARWCRALGLPKAFLPRAERSALLARAGLDAVGITASVQQAPTDATLHAVR